MIRSDKLIKIHLTKISTILVIITSILIILGFIYSVYSYLTRPQPYVQIIAFHENILPNVYNLVIKNTGNASAQFLSFNVNVSPGVAEIVNYSIEGNEHVTTPLGKGTGSFTNFEISNINPGELTKIRIQLNTYSNLSINVNKIDSKYCISTVQLNFGLPANEANKSIKIPSNVSIYIPINIINNGNCNISGEIPVELT